MAQRRQRVGIQRQDTRLSVKSLIESIEKSSHVKASNPDGISGSHCSSSSSINSMMSDVPMSNRNPITEWSESNDQTSQVKQNPFNLLYRHHFKSSKIQCNTRFTTISQFNVSYIPQMHTSFQSKSPLLEKPTPNFNCETNHNKNANNSIAKLNSNKSSDSTGLQSQSNANNTMDLNQKYGFIIGKNCVNGKLLLWHY